MRSALAKYTRCCYNGRNPGVKKILENANFLMISVISIAILLLIFAGTQYFGRMLTRRWNQHKGETVGEWAAEGVSFTLGPTGIKFTGLESMSTRSPSGLGYAVLTDHDFRVTCALPATRFWIISYKQIKGVALKDKFMGKSAKETPFIVVRFTKDAETDRLAFQVKDTEPWATRLAQAAGVSLKR